MTTDDSERRQQATIHQLLDIRKFLDHIHQHPELMIAQHEHTRNRVRFGHPAPANLDLINLTDNRVGVPATLREWATIVRDARGLATGVTHYRHTTHMLAWHTPWLYANHPDVDHYEHDIQHAHRQLRRHIIGDVQSEKSGTAVGGNR